MINPLVDAIFLIISDQKVHKVHTIAGILSHQQAFPQLDKEPNRELFKKNFLIMNALYQLQGELLQEGLFLSISSMHIQLCEVLQNTPQSRDPLRDYYLDWQNYEATKEEVIALLDTFWQSFGTTHLPKHTPTTVIKDICKHWQLPYPYQKQQLKRVWRQQAVVQHPDKQEGCTQRFKQLKAEYDLLKAHLVVID
ncbi:DNA-J related domain-containing protein [Pseudoalteromonas sp. T1lg23B]|uniref:DNA-J related domain-containing protein n=1 Tax=Pseudoalteromonas sp. T1lg23B TaxID=2077097 RepID=UPI000CF6C69B|nr:DNA-J related domain-containing protein [Pseudoalteromonas sp. T1lg23B]